MSTSGPILYPNVSSVPGRTEIDPSRKLPAGSEPIPGEFQKEFDRAVGGAAPGVDLNSVRQPLKFSAHALQRLQDRKINLDPATLSRVNNAVDKAAAKGVQDTLVLTKDAALIVSVKNRTVVTAMDRGALDGNVFTNIDGAVIV
jgi:flagellar operon protein